LVNKKGIIEGQTVLLIIAILVFIVMVFLISGGWEKMTDMVDKFGRGVVFG